MKIGQCFIYHFTDDNTKGYFFTGIIDNGYLVMCEMVAPHQMTAASFWKMTEDYFNDSVKTGQIELL